MIEYQYYEFQAINRCLTTADKNYLNRQSLHRLDAP